MIAEAARSLVKSFLPPPRGQEDAPSIFKQTSYRMDYYRFPGDEAYGIEYFNCGLVNWQNHNWLVTRRRKFTRMTRGTNDIVFWLITGKQVSNPRAVKIFVKYSGENHEDPRAINVKGQVLLSYCNFRLNSYAHQAFGIMLNDFRIPRPIEVAYGHNRADLMDGKWHEKNWTPFLTPDGKLAIVYSMHPQHEVIMIEGNSVVKTYLTGKDWSQAHWLWGEPRGGSPPVLVGTHYYAFFHSSLYHRTLEDGAKRRRYYMGAYRFSALPPYEITGMTTDPILSGSMYDRRNPGAPACVFPCGALLQNGKWLVSLGVGDTACAWIEIPHDDLRRLL